MLKNWQDLLVAIQQIQLLDVILQAAVLVFPISMLLVVLLGYVCPGQYPRNLVSLLHLDFPDINSTELSNQFLCRLKVVGF